MKKFFQANLTINNYYTLKRKNILILYNKQISINIQKANLSFNDKKFIKANHFKFSINEYCNEKNSSTFKNNPSPSIETKTVDFNLKLTEEQKINFDAFYKQMKANIDFLVENNRNENSFPYYLIFLNETFLAKILNLNKRI